uniref:Secreted protein n=1 Tax=Anopheles atroparvus TaxID=41427 RepID=A0AAG5DB35_ANOAO
MTVQLSLLFFLSRSLPHFAHTTRKIRSSFIIAVNMPLSADPTGQPSGGLCPPTSFHPAAAKQLSLPSHEGIRVLRQLPDVAALPATVPPAFRQIQI